MLFGLLRQFSARRRADTLTSPLSILSIDESKPAHRNGYRLMFDSKLFQEYPLREVRSLLILGDCLIIGCHSFDQADLVLDFADEIAAEFPQLDRVQIYDRSEFVYGFPVKLPRRR